MRSLPLIQREHPKVRVLIVGDNEPGYGGGDRNGSPLRQRMLEELAGQLDMERIHFLGRVPHPTLMALLQASWVHVYFSYPFVLGWSLLEAMACGCCIVGSRGMPVEEVIEHNVEGRLVPMDDPSTLLREKCCDSWLALGIGPVLVQLLEGVRCFTTSDSLWRHLSLS